MGTRRSRPFWASLLVLAGLCLLGTAQVPIDQALAQRPADPVGAAATSSPSAANPVPAAGAVANGAAGGGIGADFTPLLNLIQTTIAPETWEINDGTGTISEFPTGVLVDSVKAAAGGKLDKTLNRTANPGASAPRDGGSGSARQASPRRVVSLARLEQACRQRAELGQPPTEEMLVLAGLERIDQVWIDREGADVLISGPASPWGATPAGWVVTQNERRPVMRLDLLVVALRDIMLDGQRWVCSITPRAESLQAVQEYVASTQSKPLPPGGRAAWLRGLREAVGDQDVEFKGMETDTRAAHVLLAADHHMKQIGMGLAEGGPNVPSYLELVRRERTDTPPPMSVLRWWFAYVEQPVTRSEDGYVFRLARHPARVLSENQLLTQEGQRVATGESEPLNREFAVNFTRHLPELARAYPVYAELENVYQFALLAAIARSGAAQRRLSWRPTFWDDQQAFAIPRQSAPTAVASIVNAQQLRRRVLVAGVSGGVLLDPNTPVRASRVGQRFESTTTSAAERSSTAGQAGELAWWWDAAPR